MKGQALILDRAPLGKFSKVLRILPTPLLWDIVWLLGSDLSGLHKPNSNCARAP